MTWCCELDELKEWIKTAPPNEMYLYFTGCSVQDTLLSKEIGKIVYEYSCRGLGYLVQARSINYYFDWNHYIIKASPSPVYSLVPFADSKTEHWRKLKGVRNYGKDERTSQVRV